MDGNRTHSGAFLTNKRDFKEQKAQLDEVYDRYIDLYKVEKEKQLAEKTIEREDHDYKSLRAREQRYLQY